MSRSYKNYFEFIDSSGLRDGRPCDTYRVNTQLDNLIHMAESAQCVRVNWAGEKDIAYPVTIIGTDGPPYFVSQSFVFQFPMMLLSEDQYPGFDIRVCMSTSNDSAGDAYAYVMIGSTDMPIPSSTFAIGTLPGSIGYIYGNTTSSGSSQVVVNGQITTTSNTVPVLTKPQPFIDFGTGEAMQVPIPMARAIIYCAQLVPDLAYFTLDSVLIREFAPA